ncbi:MAG: DUF6691 family protein [Parvularculaceae bacterium]|nr:YeeE/YedE family protein [Parvularculaceae bacterium]
MRVLSALFVGVLFGLGLTISEMINPAKIIAFLDVSGKWDPSLLLVMASALAVSFVGYRIALSRRAPLFGAAFQLPSKSTIDRPLIIGAGLFGVGWGLAGLCPGPAVSAISLGKVEIYVFLIAMFAGMAVKDGLARR